MRPTFRVLSLLVAFVLLVPPWLVIVDLAAYAVGGGFLGLTWFLTCAVLTPGCLCASAFVMLSREIVAE